MIITEEDSGIRKVPFSTNLLKFLYRTDNVRQRAYQIF